MRITILPAANEDLINGYYFYEQQEAGIGSYFLNSLYADIESLILYQGIHPILFGAYHRMLSKKAMIN